jgi:hypothetical protein
VSNSDSDREPTAVLSPPGENNFSWYTAPAEVKELLVLAAQNWENPERSQEYINQALERSGNHPDVLVSAYRYFFYNHNDRLALQVALKVMAKVRASEGWSEEWSELAPILVDRQDDPQTRLYLNAYAASGLIRARLGELEKSREIATRVSAIDGKKEFGASVVLGILDRPAEEDE